MIEILIIYIYLFCLKYSEWLEIFKSQYSSFSVINLDGIWVEYYSLRSLGSEFENYWFCNETITFVIFWVKNNELCMEFSICSVVCLSEMLAIFDTNKVQNEDTYKNFEGKENSNSKNSFLKNYLKALTWTLSFSALVHSSGIKEITNLYGKFKVCPSNFEYLKLYIPLF